MYILSFRDLLKRALIIDIRRYSMRANETISQFAKVNYHRLKYSLQYGALAHTEQQDINGPRNY